jgi:serine-type D-Ala-D-Ala endopeptidase (penicillin-binding protein 7)
VIQARLFGKAQLIGVLGVVVTSMLPAAAAGQTATPRGPSEAQAPLTLPAADTAAAEPAPSSTSTRRKITHVVRRGETLSSIAKRYRTTVAAIKNANKLQGNSIQAGKRLAVYTTQAAPVARTARVTRAALAARTAREAQEPRFKLDESGLQVPDLRAEAAIIYNPETGKVLWEQNSQDTRSIASITKVMTAVVFLEDNPDLEREVVVTRPDVYRASTTYLRAGYKVTTGDLLHLLLIASDNAAARALARVSIYGSQGFINRMNQKAAELGLNSTHYVDPSGLLSENVSSAYDMARLISHVSGDHRISSIMQKQQHTVQAGRRSITFRSTNQLVRAGDVDVLGGKTGFIRKAGYCLATLLRLPHGGPQVAVVVLGAKSNAGRFWETRHLFNWLAGKAQEMFAPTVEAASATTASN